MRGPSHVGRAAEQGSRGGTGTLLAVRTTVTVTRSRSQKRSGGDPHYSGSPDKQG